MIRDFSRNIVQIQCDCLGQTVPLTKLDKASWKAPAGLSRLSVRYQVYAWDMSVRSAHLDTQHAFYNGTSVFLGVDGQQNDQVVVELQPPDSPELSHWRVATALPEKSVDEAGFGEYLAADYDELIDHPVEMGAFERVTFLACGIPHELVLTGRHHTDLNRVVRDLTRICEHHIRFFGEPAPMDRYVFLVMVVGTGYGGLEHRASTSLLISAENLPVPDQQEIDETYLNFLGLCSHEYFHTWNVKRIKPAVFVPYKLESESYTRLLWFFEGVTSYYDDLALLRCGLIDVDRYLPLLAKTLTRVQQGSGRLLQSVTDSSFDAWNKFYKQDENAPNAIVSYYAKGSLIALCLDGEIRKHSGGEASLDTLMRNLWQLWLKDGEGLTETQPQELASTIAGADLKDFFQQALYGTTELPMSSVLGMFGIEVQWRSRQSAKDTNDGKSLEAVVPWMGADYVEDKTGIRLTQVLSNGPAEIAGLAAGDVIVAMDRMLVGVGGVDAMLKRYLSQQTISLHYFRHGVLHDTVMDVRISPEDTCTLELVDVAKASSWFSGNLYPN